MEYVSLQTPAHTSLLQIKSSHMHLHPSIKSLRTENESANAQARIYLPTSVYGGCEKLKSRNGSSSATKLFDGLLSRTFAEPLTTVHPPSSHSC